MKDYTNSNLAPGVHAPAFMVKIGHLLSLFVRHHIKVDIVIAFVDFQVHICLENR